MEPRLYMPLRQALGTLFSLPTLDDRSRPQFSYAQAHDFLINVQSRNARRKILSIQQRYRDNLKNGVALDPASDQRPAESIAMGSSALACLCILCHHNQHAITPTEQLFAAQTLLHRLRRNKLEDAIDLEIEQPDVDEYQALKLYGNSHDTLGSVLAAYVQVMGVWNPFVANVLASANFNHVANTISETQWKGQVVLLTLASILYLHASSSADHEAIHSMPLLQTLASAVATVVLRLLGDSDDESFGFVPALLGAFHLIRQVANDSSPSPGAQHHHYNASSRAYIASLQVTLAAIPESLLGSPDGQQRKGRLSLHPNALQKAYADLRQNGFRQLRDVLLSQQHYGEETPYRSLWWSLRTLECWSRFVPLPVEMWELSLPIVQRFLKDERPEYVKSALAYLLAIWEGAACSEEEILAVSLGLTAEKTGQAQNSQQQGKKKQSSRSKRRHKELMDQRSDDSSLLQAREDVILRGKVACLAAASTWDGLIAHFRDAMAMADSHQQIDGEGPIGCLAAAAQACLPYILCHCTGESADEVTLFAALAEAIQRICASSNPLVRVLGLEPIYKLHETALSILRGGGKLDDSLESLLVEHFYTCCMSLARTCGYPSRYFDDLVAPVDEDLEIYRNDVRDLLRSTNGSEEGGSTSNVNATQEPLPIAQKILHKVLQAILAESSRPDETIVHAFSALSKPLNHQSQSWDELGGQNLETSLMCLTRMEESVLAALENGNLDERIILPISRTLCIAIASTSPMLSKVVGALGDKRDTKAEIQRALELALRVTLATMKFVELPFSDVPRHSEARGSMRGPGGEDHVSCVALKRLFTESEELCTAMMDVTKPFTNSIFKIYEELKRKELERGASLLNLQGTTPKSRRMILNVICKIGSASAIEEIFQSTIGSIAAQAEGSFDLLRLCESTYDISEFPPPLVASFFEPGGLHDLCHRVLVDACCMGYAQPALLSTSAENLIQWNRNRAALFNLIKAGGTPDIPSNLGAMIVSWMKSECEAIHSQCELGPSSHSAIFDDELVGQDGVPAGAFVSSLSALLESSPSPLPNCIHALLECTEAVLSTIVHPCPDPVGFWADGRCVLAEAWFICMTKIARIVSNSGFHEARIVNMLVNTFYAAVQLIFYPAIVKTLTYRRCNPGMTLDGPHTLALCDFLSESLGMMGPSFLQAVSHKVACTIPVDCSPELPSGMVVIAAALFRAVQGSFPPWAVEATPQIYSAFYLALGKDTSLFVRILDAAMRVRLRGIASYGGVQEGQLLSGRQFEGVSEIFHQSFLAQVTSICTLDNTGSWKKMKQVVKAACGGKKKETDYKQKPAPTKWEFDRF